MDLVEFCPFNEGELPETSGAPWVENLYVGLEGSYRCARLGRDANIVVADITWGEHRMWDWVQEVLRSR